MVASSRSTASLSVMLIWPPRVDAALSKLALGAALLKLTANDSLLSAMSSLAMVTVIVWSLASPAAKVRVPLAAV